MLKNSDYMAARKLLLDVVCPMETERVDLSKSEGRILAHDIIAIENIPPFDRSPYDGYALRAADTVGASKDTPVTLRILEEIPAGAVPTAMVSEGAAVKILTGAPIPPGADAVINYECTAFTAETVTLFSSLSRGENIVYTGEDVQAGSILARHGDRIDPGIVGTLAAQGIAAPEVYRVPKIGIFSTGNELVEANKIPGPGKIRNSNRYTLDAVLTSMGIACVYLGTVDDTTEEICELIQKGLAECDAIVSTGGVSVGDYDLTPDAMEMAGVSMLFRGVAIKPGMACAYGIDHGKLVCGLSGNPASALTNLYVIALPALKKLMGLREPLAREIKVTILESFHKKSPTTRFLRGKLNLESGTACMTLPKNQGNVVLSSAIGCDVIAEVPAGSDSVCSGTVLKGFLL